MSRSITSGRSRKVTSGLWGRLRRSSIVTGIPRASPARLAHIPAVPRVYAPPSFPRRCNRLRARRAHHCPGAGCHPERQSGVPPGDAQPRSRTALEHRVPARRTAADHRAARPPAPVLQWETGAHAARRRAEGLCQQPGGPARRLPASRIRAKSRAVPVLFGWPGHPGRGARAPPPPWWPGPSSPMAACAT